MPTLQPHIGGQNYRMTTQPARAQFKSDPVGDILGMVNKKNAFDERIELADNQNKTDTAVVNYRSDLKLLNDSFDPNTSTVEDHAEATRDLRSNYRENAPFQGDFDNKTLLPTTTGSIEVQSTFDTHVLNQKNSLRAQAYVGNASNPEMIRVQNAQQIAGQALSENIINEEQHHTELQKASMNMITHDASYGDLKGTISKLRDNEDKTWGELDGKTRNSGLKFALSVQRNREKKEKIGKGIGDFDLSKEIGAITTKEGSTPEQVYYEIEALPFEKDKDRKDAQKAYQNKRVSLRTNNTTYRTMNGKVKTALGKYGTVEGEASVVTDEESAEVFLQEVKSIQDELLRKHLDGELNYGSYIKLVDQLEPVIAQRIDEARGMLKSGWEIFDYSDNQAIDAFKKSDIGGDEERISDAFMNYHNSLDALNSDDKKAKKQFKADYGRDWEDTNQDREDITKQIIVEENYRDIDSAYKLFTTYGGRNNVDTDIAKQQPSEKDILYTMKVNKLTREEVLERLNAN